MERPILETPAPTSNHIYRFHRYVSKHNPSSWYIPLTGRKTIRSFNIWTIYEKGEASLSTVHEKYITKGSTDTGRIRLSKFVQLMKRKDVREEFDEAQTFHTR